MGLKWITSGDFRLAEGSGVPYGFRSPSHPLSWGVATTTGTRGGARDAEGDGVNDQSAGSLHPRRSALLTSRRGWSRGWRRERATVWARTDALRGEVTDVKKFVLPSFGVVVAMTAPSGRSEVGWAACCVWAWAQVACCAMARTADRSRSEDRDTGQRRQMLGSAGSGAVGFDERAGGCAGIPAGFGVGAVDEAGGKAQAVHFWIIWSATCPQANGLGRRQHGFARCGLHRSGARSGTQRRGRPGFGHETDRGSNSATGRATSRPGRGHPHSLGGAGVLEQRIGIPKVME